MIVLFFYFLSTIDHHLLAGVGTHSADPFRFGGAPEIRKVLGHGHGRARRLSLRQIPLGQSFNASMSSNAGSTNSLGFGFRTSGPGSRCSSGGGDGGGVRHPKTNGNISNGTNNNARPPKPSPGRANRTRVSAEERRKRSESMGNWGASAGTSGPGGNGWATAGLLGLAGLTTFPQAGRAVLSRAFSTGHEPGARDPHPGGEEYVIGPSDYSGGEG